MKLNKPAAGLALAGALFASEPALATDSGSTLAAENPQTLTQIPQAAKFGTVASMRTDIARFFDPIREALKITRAKTWQNTLGAATQPAEPSHGLTLEKTLHLGPLAVDFGARIGTGNGDSLGLKFNFFQ